MQKLIAIAGRTLMLSNAISPALLVNFTITKITEHPAVRSNCHSKAVLLDHIDFTCVYKGRFGSSTTTLVASGSGSIVPSTARVKCEGKAILTESDKITVTINGTTTDT